MEGRFVGIENHLDHDPRRPLCFFIVSRGIQLAVLRYVTIITCHAERRGYKFHCRNQLRLRHTVQYFDVLIDLLDRRTDLPAQIVVLLACNASVTPAHEYR